MFLHVEVQRTKHLARWSRVGPHAICGLRVVGDEMHDIIAVWSGCEVCLWLDRPALRTSEVGMSRVLGEGARVVPTEWAVQKERTLQHEATDWNAPSCLTEIPPAEDDELPTLDLGPYLRAVAAGRHTEICAERRRLGGQLRDVGERTWVWTQQDDAHGDPHTHTHTAHWTLHTHTHCTQIHQFRMCLSQCTITAHVTRLQDHVLTHFEKCI